VTPITLPSQKWDRASGVRERLALLAAIGPKLDPHVWGYHPSRDFWYYCGGAREIQGQVRVPVSTTIVPATMPTADDSLTQLSERWGIDRDTAFDLIWAEGEERIVRSGATL